MRAAILVVVIFFGVSICNLLVDIRDGHKCNRETPMGQSVCHGR